jgi:hypothetical protein
MYAPGPGDYFDSLTSVFNENLSCIELNTALLVLRLCSKALISIATYLNRNNI